MTFIGKRLKSLMLVASVALMSSVFTGCGEEVASDPNTVIVGVNFEMTGNQANYGNAAKEGLELALKHDVKDQAAYSYINIGNLYLLHDEIELAENNL